MRDLLLIVPSRGRPENLARLVDAIRETASGDVQVLACLDSDDAPNYRPIEGVWYLVKERQRFGAWTNEAALLYADTFRIVAAMGDDCVPRTKGWDAVVTETIDELGTGMCYGNDLLQGETLPTLCFMSSDIVRALGYMHPPAMVHLYLDNFWLALGTALNRIRYLPDVVIEHLHPSKGKAPDDVVYQESDALMERDRLAFEGYMKDGFEADVAKVRRMLARSARAATDTFPAVSVNRNGRSDARTAQQLPVLITCRDRVGALQRLVSWLEAVGQERIIFVDNASTFEPLLAYYRETPHQVLQLGQNLGHLAVWEADVLGTIGHKGSYVVTDCDIVPDENAPPDALDYFAELLFRHADVDKVGFGLRIDDLPDSYALRSEVIDWESQFWESEVEPGVFKADIDTTFALYRPTVSAPTFRALRTGPPYVARHLPWYNDSTCLSEEDAYYREHALPTVSNWDRPDLPEHLRVRLIEVQRRRSAPQADASVPAASGAPVPANLAVEEMFDLASLAVSQQLVAEQQARQAAERELVAIRNTRSYRWLEPARRLRASGFAERPLARLRTALKR